MKSFAIAVILSLLLAGVSHAGLDDDLRTILGDKSLGRAQVGVAIAAIDPSPRRIFGYHAETPLMPASNMKICTTSAALDLLGADFKYHTTLLLRGNDAILLGDGDPSFGDIELLKSINWTATTTFEKWADALKARNITSIHNIVVDDSIFDQTFFQPTWPTSQSGAGYEAEVAGLTINAGISIKPISRSSKQAPVITTVHDPAMYTAGVFASVLKSAGIPVTGEISRDTTIRPRYLASPKQFRAIAIHQTPLSTILARCNKDSMNVYAESLCKRLGYETAHESGSWTNGTAAVSAFLQKTGADPNQYHLEDGCGLSRNDRVSPDTLLHVLLYNFTSKNRDAFLNSLAIAGVDGTLEHRFQGALKNRIFAKTGYINGVSSLSGYLKSESDHWYAFSIIFNNVPGGVGKPTQEKLLTVLDKSAR